MNIFKHTIALVALSGMLFPHPLVAAEPASQESGGVLFDPTIHDVALTPNGEFQARLMNRNGVAVANSLVALSQAGRVVASATSDSLGRVEFVGLRGGQYELKSANRLSQIRIWTHQAAPPVASNELLLIADADVMRAQQPICNIFGQEPIMIAVLIAAAIAIPIAVHDSGS